MLLCAKFALICKNLRCSTNVAELLRVRLDFASVDVPWLSSTMWKPYCSYLCVNVCVSAVKLRFCGKSANCWMFVQNAVGFQVDRGWKRHGDSILKCHWRGEAVGNACWVWKSLHLYCKLSNASPLLNIMR